MINVVELAGALTEDPELHDLASGALRAEFTIAVKSIRWDRASGCDVIDQVFPRIVAWEDVAEQAAKLIKGSVVHVRGQITQQEVTKDGKTDRKTKVRALVVSVVRTPSEPAF